MGKFLRLIGGVPRQATEAATVTIYDQVYAVVGTINTGTAITLPSGGTYDSAELEVNLNGQEMDSVADYNYVGGVPRTQVAFTFDLLDGDQVRFKVDRSA